MQKAELKASAVPLSAVPFWNPAGDDQRRCCQRRMKFPHFAG
jgi:hypothetical protein